MFASQAYNKIYHMENLEVTDHLQDLDMDNIEVDLEDIGRERVD
jgi:hypothetical protein